jgi:hypothetical protein
LEWTEVEKKEKKLENDWDESMADMWDKTLAVK